MWVWTDNEKSFKIYIAQCAQYCQKKFIQSSLAVHKGRKIALRKKENGPIALKSRKNSIFQ